MKLIRSIFFFCCLPLLLLRCNQSSDSDVSYENINETDSVRVMRALFDTMHHEIYTGPLYQIKIKDANPSMIACGDGRLSHRLTIRFNDRGDCMIRQELNPNITSTIYEFYTANRFINDLTNDFPFFSRIPLHEIQKEIDYAKKSAKEVESEPTATEDLKAFKWNIVEEWKQRKKVLNTLDTNELVVIDSQAHIYLDYPENFKKKAEIMDSIFLTFYRIRNNSSMQYFKRSYLSLFYEYTLTQNQEIKEKLDALQSIHVINLIDRPYCKANDIWIGEYTDVPPPLPHLESNEVE